MPRITDVPVLPQASTAPDRAAEHPAKPADRGVKAAATGLVGGQNFCGGFIRAAVQMNADFQVIEFRHHG